MCFFSSEQPVCIVLGILCCWPWRTLSFGLPNAWQQIMEIPRAWRTLGMNSRQQSDCRMPIGRIYKTPANKTRNQAQTIVVFCSMALGRLQEGAKYLHGLWESFTDIFEKSVCLHVFQQCSCPDSVNAAMPTYSPTPGLHLSSLV